MMKRNLCLKYLSYFGLIVLFLVPVIAIEAESPGALPDSSVPSGPETPDSPASPRAIHLVMEDSLAAAMAGKIPGDFHLLPFSKMVPKTVLDVIAKGDSLVWIGDGGDIPKELWVGTFRPATSALAVSSAEHSPVAWKVLAFHKSLLSSAYLRPTKLLPLNNVDEQPRAQFLPLLEARDRFGEVVGFPGVLMQYYGPSTVRHRFAGSECFFFLFDRPADAMNSAGWSQLLETIAQRFRTHLQIKQVTTDYASYGVGEKVLIRAQVANWRAQAAATEIHFYSQAPGEKEFHEITKQRRSPEALSDSEASTDFLPRGRAGLWKLRVEAWQDPTRAEELGIPGNPVLVDRRDIAIVVLDKQLTTPPIISINGPSIRLQGHDGFWTGTNYYPSSSWWEWLWRDFHTLKVAEDFAAMRRTGYRIVRIWLDPVLDEQSLRATDAAIYLAAQQGIVLDVCVYSVHQWVRTMEFEREDGEHEAINFTPDNSLSSFSLQHMAQQEELLQMLARRWRGVGNIVYDISNEPVVKDIDSANMDQQVKEWKGIPQERGALRDTLLFRGWAKAMSTAIRQAGGTQPFISGQLRGGDNYLANRDADIESWHSYAEPEMAGLTTAYTDPVSSGRPMILEEFGAWGVWNDENRYDADVHYALATGAAAAMSYEWGISWLPAELNFWPPLADMVSRHRSLADVRDKSGFWHAVGIFPAPSGFNWGSTYHATPFPAAAAIALARPGRMGQDLGRATRPEKVYVVVPTSFNGTKVDMTDVNQTIKRLWQEKVVFGIYQEDSLASLPKTARVVICPHGVTTVSLSKIEELKRSGVQVFMGPGEDWQKAVEISRLSVNPGEGINLITRRTITGTLYSLFGNGATTAVAVQTERKTNVSLGLHSYALIHEDGRGINLIEAAGDVSINGAPFCSITSGRAIIASDDGEDLTHSKHLRVLATEPTSVEFEHPIQSLRVVQENQTAPLATLPPGDDDGSALKIDSELVRYTVRVGF